MVKHAYLIMAHHRFDILERLLNDIDDDRNDIFLHIDLKAKKFNEKNFYSIIKRAKLIILPREDIRWGGYSQIKCIMNLLQCATKYGYHSYYHFLVGVEFPLKSQDYIHNFFVNNNGYEFIGYDHVNKSFLERVKYKHFFNGCARNNSVLRKILNKIRLICVYIQKKVGVDYTKKYCLTFKKGNANWSISHELALYILSKKKWIEDAFKYSFCGDEVFIHTIVYNSTYYDKVFDVNDEYHSSMRMCQWEDGKNNQYHLEDIKTLVESDRLFARKIDGEDAIQVINQILSYRR